MIQISALDHLRVDDVVLFLDAILWRLDHCRVVQLVEVELDCVQELLDTSLQLQSLFNS